ncbi:MAG: zinc ribbon domain-containing protein [Methanomassiliicoccaceae archaeon]|nr:zinc ribbon domain-containing protein [Methanomassiliicoccaceae archaeon]
MASYCSNCGKDVVEGTRYCPACGFDTMSQGSGSGYNSGGYNQNNNQNQSMGGSLTIIFVLGCIWAIVAILAGISNMAVGGLLISGAINFAVGIALIMSGIFALLCCMNIHKKEGHQQACTYCLIGSILALVTIIFGIIGIILYFVLKNERSYFRS